MKLTAVFLILFCIQSRADVNAQGISLSLHNVPMERLFDEVKKQSEYDFWYESDLLKLAKKINIDIKNASITEVLELSFKDQPFTYSIIEKTIVIRKKAEQQKALTNADSTGIMDVSGRVVDENGNALEGISVTVKGTGNGTSTDKNGEFILRNISSQSHIVFTSVNMETSELRLDGRHQLSIKLRPKSASLSGVEVQVNTGYQSLPKERSTGAFEFISNKQLNQRVGSDILSRLDGVTTGIFIDRRNNSPSQNTINANNITIRGLSTLTETIKSPLVILNNFPYEGDINNINPNDVENITILKDAAAASIWGARAGNGVIVITTKQGRYNRPTSISFNANVNIIEQPRLFYYPQMSSEEYIQTEKFLFDNGYYDATLTDPAYPAVTPVVEILNKLRDGEMTSSEADIAIGALKNSDVRNDFNKYIYRKSVNQQYAVNVTGGTDKIKYAFSGGFDKNPSVLKGNDMQRVTFRTENSFAIVKNLELTLTGAYTNTIAKNNSLGDIGSAGYNYKSNYRTYNLYPYAQFADANGNPLTIEKDYRDGFTDTAGAGILQDWKYRPLDELNNADNTLKSQDLLLNFQMKYKISGSLGVLVRYQFEETNDETRSLKGLQTYYARNLINLFTQTDGTSIFYPLPVGGILDLTNQKMVAQAGNIQIDFSHRWKDKHELFAIAGTEIRDKVTSSAVARYYGYDPNTLLTSDVDLYNYYPQYDGLDYGSATISSFAGSQVGLQHLTNRFVSFFANAAYTYGNRYTLSLSARKDATNLFGVNTNDRWKPFWSAGAAWNIFRESFYNIKAISSLRLRATYGYQGNVNNSITPLTVITYYGVTSLNQPYALINGPANPNLTWERIGTFNIGIDFGALKNRLNGSIEWYQKTSSNLILSKRTDPTVGFNYIAANSADLSGKGVELTLNSSNLTGKFKWNTVLLFNYASYKVTKYLLDDQNRSSQGFVNSAGLSILSLVGRNPYGIFSYPSAGLDPATGDPRGYLGKTISKDYYSILQQSVDTANLIYSGPGTPPYFGYLNNSFSYNGFSLVVSLSYRFGYYFKKNTINYYSLYESGVTNPDFKYRWQKPGDEKTTTVPSMVYPLNDPFRDNFYSGTTANVLRADNVRLDYIRLSYDFPKSMFGKIPVQNLQLYVYANNLGIIWRANNQKLDPDNGIANPVYPSLRSVAFGLKLDF
ncbi:MAG: SusC/RagA family TonB-linked outer membrane protein [Bacteroidetes bacterium]|nr:SusC/RagA family TonB-linked outer membrane protein [Bacteroidota bacterium]